MAQDNEQQAPLAKALKVALSAHDAAVGRFVLFNAAVFCMGLHTTARQLPGEVDRAARDVLHDERCHAAADLASVAVLVDHQSRQPAVAALAGQWLRPRMQLSHLLEPGDDAGALRAAMMERLGALGVEGSGEDDFARLHRIKADVVAAEHPERVMAVANRWLHGITTEAIASLLSRPTRPTSRRDPLEEVLGVARAAQLDAVERAAEHDLSGAESDLARTLAGKVWGRAVAAFATSANVNQTPDPATACRDPLSALAASEQVA